MGRADSTQQRFSTFLANAQALQARRSAQTQHPPNARAFAGFLGQSRTMLQQRAERLVSQLTPVAKALSDWVVGHDLLSVAGYSMVETAYTNLLAWALFPPEQPSVALQCQREWAARVAPNLKITHPVKPRHQFDTSDGIPDLVLFYDTGVIVVEAKTKTGEHNAPSGIPQTIAYPKSVAQRLALNSEDSIHVVFLTPDGRPGRNQNACCTTYESVGISLAKALNQIAPIDESLRQAYRLLISHWVSSTEDEPGETIKIIRLLSGRSTSTTSENDLSHQLSSLERVCARLTV